MKKLIILFAFMLIFCLTSCDSNAKYHLEVIENSVSPNLPKTGYYKAKQSFSFKIMIVYDTTFRPYLNNEELKPIKNSDNGFTYYSFTMPECDSILELSSDQFYIDRSYYFNELFSWVDNINEDNLSGIKIESGIVNNDSFISNSIIYSEDIRDIKYNISILKNEPLIKVDADESDNVAYKKIAYILDDGIEYTFTIYNDLIFWFDFSSFQYFKLVTSTNYPGIKYPNN